MIKLPRDRRRGLDILARKLHFGDPEGGRAVLTCGGPTSAPTISHKHVASYNLSEHRYRYIKGREITVYIL